jgi:exodeoxyribonuclease VII large subunit
MPDDIPSLADLRRTRAKRPTSPSLFDDPTPETVTTADILAEQSRSLHAPSKPSPSAQEVYTVGELVRRVRTLVERTYGHVTVEGEISNWRPAASGHCYFTLKDGDAQLSIVLFRRQAALLRFRPKDGDAVRICGQLSVYESRGQMQLIAESMQQTGLGALLAAVQALKDRLRREGLFDNARPLPPFPRCIGIVTSLHGAALRDIVKVCRRRHATVNLLIYPAAVQGPNCPSEVAAGIRWFSSHPDRADVVLIARGGGSWEDLHGFDDETLARTIAVCSIPVITGIGHATDTTIADAAADLHAPTPSAAAELVTAAQHRIEERVLALQNRVLRATRFQLLTARQRFLRLSADQFLIRLRDTVSRRDQRLDELRYRLESAAVRRLRAPAARLAAISARLGRQDPTLRLAAAHRRIERATQTLTRLRSQLFLASAARLDQLTARLNALSPLAVLNRGYALIYQLEDDPEAFTAGDLAENRSRTPTLLRSAASAHPGQRIHARLANGTLEAQITASHLPETTPK